VEWHLTLKLFLLQLNRLISLSTYPLGKDFFKPLGLNNVYQDVMALLDEAEAESSETNLGNSAVVEDLATNVLQMDAVSNMSLQQ
jgi:hypothetical protein